MNSKTRHAEIAGAWLPNKGAELMAHTVVAELSHRIPYLCFWSHPQGDSATRTEIGMPTPQQIPGAQLAKRARQLVRWPSRDERVMIDISGFAYGDHWGLRKAYNRAGKAIRHGRAVYLLPQAFGPFDSDSLAQEMRRILKKARMVAARDETSLQHLQRLDPRAEIALLPDITVSLDVSKRHLELPNGKYGCLILNRKTAEGSELNEEGLINLYHGVAEEFRRFDVEPIIVLHEPLADRSISEELAKRSGLTIVSHADARDTKRFLLGAECIVTGRFHGLVSGLSGGVPSFAVSWSHKYGELLRTYGCSDALYGATSGSSDSMSSKDDKETFIGEINKVLSDESWRTQYRAKLYTVAQEQKARLSGYWDALAEDISEILK